VPRKLYDLTVGERYDVETSDEGKRTNLGPYRGWTVDGNDKIWHRFGGSPGEGRRVEIADRTVIAVYGGH
jgi:hypothetical protein